MSTTRRRLLDDTFKKSVVGNPAVAVGSLARRGPGITMQGWTEQDGTPTPETPVPIINAGSWRETAQKYEYQVKLFKNFGLKRNIPTESDNWSRFTFNERWNEIDKIICKMSGVNQVGQNIIFCGEDSTGVAGIPYINLGDRDDNQQSGLYDFSASKAGYEISDGGYYELEYTFSSDSNNLICNVWDTQWSKEIIYYEIAFYKNNILIEKYVPVVNDPNKMYGEVSKTYIRNDKNMGYELVEPISDYQFQQTVTLTADRPLTKWDRLEKRGGQWGWVYKSEEIESYTDGGVPGEYFSTTGQLSVGAQVWYETTTETFVPLTTAEQEAMNALHTYRPTTVLSNQQDCEMALTYKTRKSMEVTA